ncbi:hypothetical protein TRFO_15966 [Tritrichomonas foetus]|uniref:Right handed beta helix domain-containing protein n=1 Tax=Tritrichomonas foetus TaxID=1144522 RepID=A0A1J4KRC2_9EUKA|nr:hypothetical protein TRFO_15966 [Tritrichomonas foetus]|eukprot:OHT13833.1 hypothetical protein TRFO_15966 [Tritrichomonas foetus]
MLVENCTFQECQSVKGGGIYFQDGHQTGDEEGRVVNCTFDNCQGTNGNAIYSRSYNFTLSECTFINNFGGDSYLYVYSNEAWVLPNISHCTFRGNKLDGIIFSSSMITIESCIFEDYDVSGSMSGIMNVQNDWLTTEVALIMITFNNCKFRNNKHRSFMISNSAAGIVLNSCEFTNNSNTYGNQYNNMGACIYGEDCFYLLITSCSFKHNIVLYKGSCFYGLSHLVRISYSTFLNNSATHDTGGAIYMEQTQTENMTILHCSFDSCSAGTYGGAMYFYAKDQSVTSYSWIPIEIRDCTFNNYSSTEEGGAISSGFASISSSSGDNDMFIVNCAFSLCESVKGGCIYFQDGKETGDEEGRIENCTFNNCKGQLGTCIYTRAYNFSLTDSTFSNNINGESYLYIAMDEENVAPIIQRCKFQGNKDARIVIAIKEHLDLVDCEFVSNSQSESDGGGIMLDQTSIPKGVLFTNCIFNYNSATKGYGGAVFITTTIFELSKCSFNRNSALNGGALYIKSDTGYIHLFDDTSTAKVLECSFGSNAASESGGSIYTSTSDSLLISSCNFTYSNANDLGSSIYSDLRGQLTINKLNILASQLFETPSIYITGTSTSGAVLINGSCFSGTKYANDEKASFIIFESSGTIQLTGDVCISGDKESTINGIDSSLPDSYFNCNECEAPTIPDITDVPSSGVIEPTIDSSSSSDDDGSGGDDSQGGGGNKKLGGGSIAGIVIGVIVFVAILIFLVIFFIKRKTETEEKEEAISQEVVDDSVKTFSQEPAWSNNFDSNEYQNSTQNDNYEDPFMREFEEAGA